MIRGWICIAETSVELLVFGGKALLVILLVSALVCFVLCVNLLIARKLGKKTKELAHEYDSLDDASILRMIHEKKDADSPEIMALLDVAEKHIHRSKSIRQAVSELQYSGAKIVALKAKSILD